MSASSAIHDTDRAKHHGSPPERRRHVRYPLRVGAHLALPGGGRRPCRIEDFGSGGLYLALDGPDAGSAMAEVGPLARDDRVVVHFAGEQGVSGRAVDAAGMLSISAPVARAMPTGVGLRFTDLDPSSVQAVRRLAALVSQAHKPAPAATLLDPAFNEPPAAVADDAMRSVRCLMRLEGHLRSAESTPESIAALATSDASPSRMDSQARELVIDALAIVQRAPEFQSPDENEPLVLEDRVMTTWEAAGLTVTEADASVVEIISKLLDAMLCDPLVAAQVKQCMRRLAIALLKVALQDGDFFANEQHPARVALNRLGCLEPSIIGADRWRAVIDPLVSQMLAESDKGARVEGRHPVESIFSDALTQLDALCEEQNQRRGEVRMVDPSKLPIVERSLLRMLNDLHQRIVHRVHVDEASGLLNRKAMQARVEEALCGTLTMSAGHALCVLELDALAAIVQTCGQKVAGELLRNFVPVLQQHVHHKGIAARLQAGRFAVLLHHCDVDGARAVMDALRAAMECSRCKWRDKSFQLSIGIGLVPMDAHSGSVAALFERADEAYRAARAAGGNRVHVHQGYAPAGEREDASAAMISRIIGNGGLQLRCQRVTPIGADAAALPQYEILLGVKNAHGAVTLPGDFLHAALRHNRIPEVDRWVMQATLHWMANHLDRVDEVDGYAINVAGATLADEHLLGFVRRLFAQTRVSPAKIVFEISQGCAIDSLPAAASFIRAMRGDGCRVCLGKFGSAEMSLARLQALPIDYLKIDGALVRDIAADPRDLMVVRSLNEIGHFLGKKTVAECVEGPEVMTRLRRIGVDFAQGFAVEEPALLQ